MEELTEILQTATSAIAPEYFLLPLHGADPVYRERVYCYELYHQMRQQWPDDCPWRLNGEVDKQAHPYFHDGGAPKPDLLVHVPGTGNNYAVFEVKSCHAQAAGIQKDIETLSLFTQEFGYQRGIYLIFGEDPGSAVDAFKKLGSPENIELWLHQQAGTSVVCVE